MPPRPISQSAGARADSRTTMCFGFPTRLPAAHRACAADTATPRNSKLFRKINDNNGPHIDRIFPGKTRLRRLGAATTHRRSANAIFRCSQARMRWPRATANKPNAHAPRPRSLQRHTLQYQLPVRTRPDEEITPDRQSHGRTRCGSRERVSVACGRPGGVFRSIRACSASAGGHRRQRIGKTPVGLRGLLAGRR